VLPDLFLINVDCGATIVNLSVKQYIDEFLPALLETSRKTQGILFGLENGHPDDTLVFLSGI